MENLLRLRLFPIYLLLVLHVVSYQAQAFGLDTRSEESCKTETGCSENCEGDADDDRDAGSGYCRTGLSRNATEVFEKQSHVSYYTRYTRNCRCLECGGMSMRQCDNLCYSLRHRHYRCRRCSCQCGRRSGEGSTGGASAQDEDDGGGMGEAQPTSGGGH